MQMSMDVYLSTQRVHPRPGLDSGKRNILIFESREEIPRLVDKLLSQCGQVASVDFWKSNT